MKALACLFLLLLPCQVLADDIPTLAIVDFTSSGRTPRLEKMLPDLISEKLIDAELFDVLEREKLKVAVTELGFSGSGLVSQDKAIEVGKMIGSQYMLTGKILDFSSRQTSFNNYGVNIRTTTVRLDVSVDIIETATSRKVFSKKANSEKKFQEMGGLRVSDDTAGVELAEEVASKLVADMVRSNKLQAIAKANTQTESATITITSTPENASVEIDGVFYGNTGDAFDVPTGLHKVTISLPGHEVWEKKVMVKDGLNFHVDLSEKVDQKIKIDVKEAIKTN
jgi:curli biogenesis system outer membrane secretion channel CsgG